MHLDEISEFNDENIWYYAIRLRNAFIVLITDDATGKPAFGNVAVSAPARISGKPIISSSFPFISPKYEVLGKSMAEIIGKKLKSPVILHLDVKFEPTDVTIIKAMKLALNDFCKKIVEENQ
ncbi:MAG: proteasome assembly chaperone 4 family protein [Candidatus Hodarchaeota archaeon]